MKMKSGSTSKIMSSIRNRVMEYVPKEYSAYINCSKTNCGKERDAYNKSLEGSDEKIKSCINKSGDIFNVKKCSKDAKTMKKCIKSAKTMKKTIKQNMKKCIKNVIQGSKEYKTMRKCAIKNCDSERKKLRSSIKKYKSHLMKHIKSHVSKSKKSKSKSSRK
jgi:hypothetical protein